VSEVSGESLEFYVLISPSTDGKHGITHEKVGFLTTRLSFGRPEYDDGFADI
jgi:hypothetical protein